MTRHTCHLPGCEVACPPRHLYCRAHWDRVPRELQEAVYATVKLRNPEAVDASWAPWWRAQAQATAAVLRQLDHPEERIGRLLRRAEDFAATLEDS